MAGFVVCRRVSYLWFRIRINFSAWGEFYFFMTLSFCSLLAFLYGISISDVVIFFVIEYEEDVIVDCTKVEQFSFVSLVSLRYEASYLRNLEEIFSLNIKCSAFFYCYFVSKGECTYSNSDLKSPYMPENKQLCPNVKKIITKELRDFILTQYFLLLRTLYLDASCAERTPCLFTRVIFN